MLALLLWKFVLFCGFVRGKVVVWGSRWAVDDVLLDGVGGGKLAINRHIIIKKRKGEGGCEEERGEYMAKRIGLCVIHEGVMLRGE